MLWPPTHWSLEGSEAQNGSVMSRKPHSIARGAETLPEVQESETPTPVGGRQVKMSLDTTMLIVNMLK